MKNWKLSRKITLGIMLIVIMCMSLLYMTVNKTLKGVMQESERNHMESVLAAQTSLIEEYVTRQEKLLIAYSKTPVVRELLKDVNNAKKNPGGSILYRRLLCRIGQLGRYLYW